MTGNTTGRKLWLMISGIILILLAMMLTISFGSSAGYSSPQFGPFLGSMVVTAGFGAALLAKGLSARRKR